MLKIYFNTLDALHRMGKALRAILLTVRGQHKVECIMSAYGKTVDKLNMLAKHERSKAKDLRNKAEKLRQKVLELDALSVSAKLRAEKAEEVAQKIEELIA
ncbi:hypothetical protein ACQU0X_08395 [Pseudovibrio ascidiaceicola]|uniref:hypothetical protein n=1 Tax=Pseudovibrio ascidiaceicola TaxID=285279 RepID=UPI003D35FD0B